MIDFKQFVPIFLKGTAIGMAEVVPGVSGGTIAFISGIYERLLNCISAFSPKLIGEAKKNGLAGVWKAIDGTFLACLLIGMVMGIGIGITAITYLIKNHPVPLWGFFFGLILASILYIFKQITHWNVLAVLLVFVGTFAGYYVTVATPASGNHAHWFVFVSGIIAISALILPGISGSFMLLLMGMYSYIIGSVKTSAQTLDPSSVIVVFVFGLGCLTGLLTSARVLLWTLTNYKNPTLAVLAGFMIGSLNKIWPWRKATEFLYGANGQPSQVLKEINLLPTSYLEATGQQPQIALAVALGAFGFILVYLLDRYSEK